jgi:DnaJ-class molecular chaperone
MSAKTHYDTLGVDKNASPSDIKKAYRALSLKYHPDRNPDENAKTRFQEINAAYEVLGDDAKRQAYDMGPNEGVQFHNMSGFHNMGGPGDFPDINGLFHMMFNGGMGGMGGPNIRIFRGGVPMHQGDPNIMRPPEPIVKQIELTIEQSYSGCVMPVEIERWTLNNGIKTIEVETLYVNIPQGIDNNEIILITEKGHIVNQVMRGDIKLVARVTNNSIFKRNGLDLIYKQSIQLKEALCGFSIEFVHLSGKRLRLNNTDNPSVIRPGHRNVFRSMGMTREQTVGNLILELDVIFPDSLTAEQIASLSTIL